MNFIEFESPQKLRGGFYTAPEIASFLAKWVVAGLDGPILEPSCGDGAFVSAIQELNGGREVEAFEIDVAESQKAGSRAGNNTTVRNVDFLSWYLSNRHLSKFAGVVGNPPFIRYQYLPQRQQDLAERIFGELRLPFTRHTNAWVPFVLASLDLLRPGGRIAMVVPSEILHIPHAQSLRTFLGTVCSQILILDPEEIWFDDTLQGTVLLLAEKAQKECRSQAKIAATAIRDRADLSIGADHFFAEAKTAPVTAGKWMGLFLTSKELALVESARLSPLVKPLVEIADVDVGIVTGANKFFLVSDDVVEARGLADWAHPMFGRSEHVKGLIYTKADHASNKRAGLPANLLWFQEESYSKLPKRVQKYLCEGIEQKIDTRFKCRTRRVWYKVPSVYASPVSMLKRCHHFPRLILNSAGAYTTDTAYRVQPTRIAPQALVVNFANCLTSLSAELEGRHYGGGVLELVPSEIERLLIPVSEAGVAELRKADATYRSCNSQVDFLAEASRTVLSKIGMSRDEIDTIRDAWIRLHDRRMRLPGERAGPASTND